MNELRRCRNTWMYCDGRCSRCATVATSNTTMPICAEYITADNKTYFSWTRRKPMAKDINAEAYIKAVNEYIANNANEDANFLAGLETAVVIAEKMAGVYEEVEE